MSDIETRTEDGHSQKQPLPTLIAGAIGVVYGDIGTSPLYAFKETFSEAHGLPLDQQHVFDVLSLIFWTLAIIVTLKYVVFILRADNRGEGGSFALQALASRISGEKKWLMAVIPTIGIFAASLFYGDAMITPAISVLSAVEGLSIINPGFSQYVIPITLFILIGLFVFQKLGTDIVGKFFGPIMLLWFLTLGTLGVINIMQNPEVLKALNPYYIYDFFARDTLLAFLTMGTVVLCVTGAEALYADMGHFGRKPIRYAWLGFVWPTLILNYFGQGAFVLREPDGIGNPFYMMAPDWFEVPLVLLATAATVIASQAVISGAFSLTKQAVQLGYMPRMNIIHTSHREIGQIYVPFVNWTLLVFIIGLVLGFKSSSNLAAAYGVAVTGTMILSSILLTVIALRMWKWNIFLTAIVMGTIIFIDSVFFISTSLKIAHGGWFPLALGLVMLMLLTTWKTGRRLVIKNIKNDMLPVDIFFSEICERAMRVPGTAIFMTHIDDGVPISLMHNLKHNKILHERNIFLQVRVEEKPFIDAEKRYEINDLGQGFFKIALHYGFKDVINVPEALFNDDHGFDFHPNETTFFVGREVVIPTKLPGMAIWREHVFSLMSRNSASFADFYKLPSKRTMELGSRIDI